ncbi:MAG: hypothetical protein ACI9LO_000837 [Planctomycetota bacterium]|jgi:hypothetical protein
MRKVNNKISSRNPGLMFAQGLESLISDTLHHPGRIDHVEIERKQRLANKQESRGNLFSILMRQFASS